MVAKAKAKFGEHFIQSSNFLKTSVFNFMKSFRVKESSILPMLIQGNPLADFLLLEALVIDINNPS